MIAAILLALTIGELRHWAWWWALLAIAFPVWVTDLNLSRAFLDVGRIDVLERRIEELERRAPGGWRVDP